jgi:hypothetical protein
MLARAWTVAAAPSSPLEGALASDFPTHPVDADRIRSLRGAASEMGWELRGARRRGLRIVKLLMILTVLGSLSFSIKALAARPKHRYLLNKTKMLEK